MRPSIALAAMGGLLVTVATRPDTAAPASWQAREDSSRVAQLLANARNATPLLCEFTIRILGGYGRWNDGSEVPDALPRDAEIVDWASRDLEDGNAIPILDAGLADSDACVRRVSARLLGRMDHPDSESHLMTRLGATDPAVREMAAIGLGFSDRRTAVAALVDALTDRHARVRAASAWALGAIEDRSAIAALAALLDNDEDPSVRTQAARAIGSMY